MKEILRDLEILDWGDVEKVNDSTQKALFKLSEKLILSSLLHSVLNNKELISLSEHYDFFDKLVLYKDRQDRFRIRLHVFLPEASHKDRVHFHRWLYSSLILQGNYKHSIYGTEDQISDKSNPQNLKPIIIQEEKVGSFYTLNHNVIHSVEAEPYTISLFIRGPAVKDRFLIMDRKTGRRWWEYGRECEAIEEIERKAMNIIRIEKIVRNVREWSLI